eukprot:gnl/Chilomastix_cuspidata/1730.p2 GENE.gnl/Chilomastix_cuspidata/1730~~gnl/Chilomastix_cuspidata/1730.p2  ORF type:complete len:515 (+),score=225.49 gnl/Chilomastix_cuspidata/1730:2622-4166(+)
MSSPRTFSSEDVRKLFYSNLIVEGELDQAQLDLRILRNPQMEILMYGADGTTGPLLLKTIQEKEKSETKQIKKKRIIKRILSSCVAPRFPQLWLLSLSDSLRSIFEIYMQSLPPGAVPDPPERQEVAAERFKFMVATRDVFDVPLPVIGSTPSNPLTIVQQVGAIMKNGNLLTREKDAEFLFRFAVQIPMLAPVSTVLNEFLRRSPLYAEGGAISLQVQRIFSCPTFYANARAAIATPWTESVPEANAAALTELLETLFAIPERMTPDTPAALAETLAPHSAASLATIFAILLGGGALETAQRSVVTRVVRMLWFITRACGDEWSQELAKAGIFAKLIAWIIKQNEAHATTAHDESEEPTDARTQRAKRERALISYPFLTAAWTLDVCAKLVLCPWMAARIISHSKSLKKGRVEAVRALYTTASRAADVTQRIISFDFQREGDLELEKYLRRARAFHELLVALNIRASSFKELLSAKKPTASRYNDASFAELPSTQADCSLKPFLLERTLPRAE